MSEKPLLERHYEYANGMMPHDIVTSATYAELASASKKRISKLELALHQIAGHGNITGERARAIASEALGENPK